MSTTKTLTEVKWQLRRAIRQSNLGGVNRSDSHIFICNWSDHSQKPGTICEEIRDMFRKKERNAFLPSDLRAFLSHGSTSSSREKILRQAARTANVVFIIYNRHVSTDQLGQPAEIALSEITPSHPPRIRNRVKPFAFCENEKVELPHMPGSWSTTQPRITDRDTLQSRIRLIANNVRSEQEEPPGKHWYEI